MKMDIIKAIADAGVVYNGINRPLDMVLNEI